MISSGLGVSGCVLYVCFGVTFLNIVIAAGCKTIVSVLSDCFKWSFFDGTELCGCDLLGLYSWV